MWTIPAPPLLARASPISSAANFYSGPYGLQVLELSPPPSGAALATLLAGINGAPSGVAGYEAMVADGFKLEAELDGNNNSPVGGYYIGVGVVNMWDVVPTGGNIILGLAVWNTSTSFATMLTSPGAHLGVISFPQATVNAGLIGPSIPPDISAGWLSLNGGQGQELVMGPVPEPGALRFGRPGRCRPVGLPSPLAVHHGPKPGPLGNPGAFGLGAGGPGRGAAAAPAPQPLACPTNYNLRPAADVKFAIIKQ